MTARGKTLSNAAYSSAGLYIEYLFGLIASILVARALGPADLGVYSLLVWIVSTAVIVANAGITTAAIKFVAELQGAGRHDMIGPLVRKLQRLQKLMLLSVAAATALILWLGRDRLAPGMDPWVLALVVGSLLLRAPYMFGVALAKGAQDFRSVALIAAVSATFNLAMIAAALAWGAGLPTFIVIFAVSGLVFFAMSRWRTEPLLAAARRDRALLDAKLDQRVSHHLRVVAFTIVLGSVGSTEIELPFLNLLAGPEQAGLFKVANALAMGAALLAPGVLSAQLLPMMANAYGRGREQAAALIAGATAWLFVLGAPLIALAAVFSKEAIHLLYGPAFAPAAFALSVLMVGRVSSTLGQGASAYLVSADRQTALMKLTLLFTALRLLGAAAGTYWFGLEGAVVTSAVLSVAGSGSTIALALRETHSRLPWGRLARIAMAAALAAACSAPAAWLQPPLLSLAVGGAVFAFAYPAALWLLRCLHPEDAAYARQMLAKLTGGRLGAGRTG